MKKTITVAQRKETKHSKYEYEYYSVSLVFSLSEDSSDCVKIP
jgi:hypothetical protein